MKTALGHAGPAAQRHQRLADALAHENGKWQIDKWHE
jgi:hypothetical protein